MTIVVERPPAGESTLRAKRPHGNLRNRDAKRSGIIRDMISITVVISSKTGSSMEEGQSQNGESRGD